MMEGDPLTKPDNLSSFPSPQGRSVSPLGFSPEKQSRKPSKRNPKTHGPICLADPPTLRPAKCPREPCEQLRLLLQMLESNYRQVTELVSNVLNTFDAKTRQLVTVPLGEPFPPRPVTRKQTFHRTGEQIEDIRPSQTPLHQPPFVVTPTLNKTNSGIVHTNDLGPLPPTVRDLNEAFSFQSHAAIAAAIRRTDSCEASTFDLRGEFPRSGIGHQPHLLPGIPLEDFAEQTCVRTCRGVRFAKSEDNIPPPVVQPVMLENTPRIATCDTAVARTSVDDFESVDHSNLRRKSSVAWSTSLGKLATFTRSSKNESRENARKLTKALRRRAIFQDKSEMLEKVLDALGTDEYNVHDYYKTTGVCQAVARSQIFENITLLVIFLNAFWIAIEIDLNPDPVLIRSNSFFIVAENFFCSYFVFEWLCRLFAFRRKLDGFHDSWFVFDMALACCMALETWVLSIFMLILGTAITNEEMKSTWMLKLPRLLRLTRTARMVRLLQWIPELMIMLKGLMTGFRSVATTLLLLLIIVYIFSIAFRQVTDGTQIGKKYFSSVPSGMLNLIVYGIIPDVQDIVLELQRDSIVTGFLGFSFILVGSITVLNLLVGVLVEAVSVVACVEKEESAARFVKGSLAGILEECHGWNPEEEHEISKDDFQRLVSRKEFAKVMVEVGVDIANLVGLSEWLFKGGRMLPVAEFYKLIMQLRGSNYATVKDIVDMRKYLTDCTEQLEETIMSCCGTGEFYPERGTTRSSAPRRSSRRSSSIIIQST
eukprot:TRINITY_DN40160_c0_g1_i1.p1 TRINITY_DN40160_c0_g1~~TRINITY_DN40160_c0_g1_i1.p1  ORF type:complete len:764 (+),score=76.82 TRINITY_DN40160_c0_g1_i1:45-2336(+)